MTIQQTKWAPDGWRGSDWTDAAIISTGDIARMISHVAFEDVLRGICNVQLTGDTLIVRAAFADSEHVIYDCMVRRVFHQERRERTGFGPSYREQREQLIDAILNLSHHEAMKIASDMRKGGG